MIQKADMFYKYEGSQSRSEFIEKAILFYSGYISAEDGRDYFPEVIVSTLQGSLDTFVKQIKCIVATENHKCVTDINFLVAKEIICNFFTIKEV